jgi:hypothetical protein
VSDVELEICFAEIKRLREINSDLLAVCEALERWSKSESGHNLEDIKWSWDLSNAVIGARKALEKAEQ